MLFKILFLSFVYDFSLREIEEQINDRLSFKWFLGLAVNDFSPDHSTLTVFRDRLEEAVFRIIFNRKQKFRPILFTNDSDYFRIGHLVSVDIKNIGLTADAAKRVRVRIRN